MIRPLSLAILLRACLCLPASAEQVDVFLPGSVTLRAAGLGWQAVSPPVSVTFRHARLERGHVLRIGVTTDSPEVRISFATRSARGGIGRFGVAGSGLHSTVFESAPSAMAGGFEVVWALEGPARAGAQAVRLRWRIESVPADAAATLQDGGGARRSGRADGELSPRSAGFARDRRRGADGPPPGPLQGAAPPAPAPPEDAPSMPGQGLPGLAPEPWRTAPERDSRSPSSAQTGKRSAPSRPLVSPPQGS